ncbi:MAG TPA: hypothetical protein VMK84_17930, partial [Streptosporangiaceae bacterium]|nr:hypothetical protein [Streptosporangiaceae bacterium]
MEFRHAAQGARGLDPDPDRGRGEVGERDLLHLDDPHRLRVGAGRDGPLAGLVARLVEDGLPAVGAEVEDPVHLAADRRDGGADGVGRVEVLRPDDLADAGYPVGNQDAAAADGDERTVLLGGLDPVDRLGEHHVGPGQRLAEQPPVAADPVRAAIAPGAEVRPARRDRAVGQRRRRPAEDQRVALQQVADAARADADVA